MAASVFDSAMFRDLFGDTEVGRLFTDSAEVRAMLLVEGSLAKIQGELGIIPKDSADAIRRASLEIQIDPGALAKETGQSAVVVPALVKAFRQAMEAPEHAQYVHWGATSQDIMDTALVLRLRQVVAIFEERLKTLIRSLGNLAEKNADLPMAGRTYSQVATPTSFGAVVAGWGSPLIRHMDRLNELKPRLLQVSLSGAVGTLSAMGPDGARIRAGLAKELKLADPRSSWHSERDTFAEFSGWISLVTGSLGKMGEDLTLMTQTGIQEISLAQSGGSSTMPQKSNPVLPSLLGALARQSVALNSVMQAALSHRQQRDGAAWLTEWMTLPQLCLVNARALTVSHELATGISANPERMLAGIDDGLGLIYAEALSFRLVEFMRRPDAQAATKELCKQSLATKTPLQELALEKWPQLEVKALFNPKSQLGTAPQAALDFASATRMI